MTGEQVPEMVVLDSTMKDFMVEKDVSAGALAITRHGKMIFARGYTWSNHEGSKVLPDSLFRIASLSKPVTAAGIMRLVEEKTLSLDDKVADILDLTPPDGEIADSNLGDVTIRHLLQHLGGWDRDIAYDPMFQDKRISKSLGVSPPITARDIIRFMNGQPLQHKPGVKFSYSNYGYCLLGRVIEQKSGETYGDYMQDAVLSPLGISGMHLGRSSLHERLPGEVIYESKGSGPYGTFNLENMDSHGGWLASAPDMVRFASLFDDPCHCPLLSAQSLETMFSLPQNIKKEFYKRAIVTMHAAGQ